MLKPLWAFEAWTVKVVNSFESQARARARPGQIVDPKNEPLFQLWRAYIKQVAEIKRFLSSH